MPLRRRAPEASRITEDRSLSFFQEDFVDVCWNARGHASCQDEKLCIFEMRDDAVDHAIYRVLAHRAAFVVEFAHRAVGFVEDF